MKTLGGLFLLLALTGCGGLFGSSGDRHFRDTEYHLFSGRDYTVDGPTHRWTITTVAGTETTEYRELPGKETHEARRDVYQQSLGKLGTYSSTQPLPAKPGETLPPISMLSFSRGFAMILTDERSNGHTFVVTCSLATPSETVEGGAVGLLNMAGQISDCRSRLIEIRRLATE